MADLLPKECQTQLAPEGGRKTMTIIIRPMIRMMMMMMMITILTMMNIMCFLHPKGPQTGLVPGGPIKYDDDDDFDDNDNDGDDDDDDGSDSDGNDLIYIFFRIIVFEAPF